MNLSKMNLSIFSPSYSWNNATIRPTKLHCSRISSRSNFYFWKYQLLRELIFKRSVGKMWVQLCNCFKHQLRGLAEGMGIHVTLSFYTETCLFLHSPFQYFSVYTHSFLSLPWTRSWMMAMDRYLQSAPITAPLKLNNFTMWDINLLRRTCCETAEHCALKNLGQKQQDGHQ